MRQSIILCLLALACFLSGCGGQKNTAGEQEDTYLIYYLNPGGTRLVAQPYQTGTTDKEKLIEELMEQFLTVPSHIDCQTTLTDRVTYQGYKREDMVLYLYFDNNYIGMKAEREILCRAALAKTMTQIPEIAYISVYCGEQPLLDSKGNPTGMISTADIIEGISDINAFEKTELVLYFTDKEGINLLEERRSVIYNTNTSMERLVVEELLKGPEQEEHYPTLTKDFKLLNVSVTESVCYVNFDGGFLNQGLEVRDYIPIYSIVNSLLELHAVSRVQITVNGATDVLFRDSISLNTEFERNLDYIIGGNDN